MLLSKKFDCDVPTAVMSINSMTVESKNGIKWSEYLVSIQDLGPTHPWLRTVAVFRILNPDSLAHEKPRGELARIELQNWE